MDNWSICILRQRSGNSLCDTGCIHKQGAKQLPFGTAMKIKSGKPSKVSQFDLIHNYRFIPFMPSYIHIRAAKYFLLNSNIDKEEKCEAEE